MLSFLLTTLTNLPQHASKPLRADGVDHALVASTNLSAAR